MQNFSSAETNSREVFQPLHEQQKKHFNTQGTEGGTHRYFARIRDRNSSRVLGLSLNEPSIALVTVWEFSFSTPRITMQRCRPSMTTPTPNGAIFCWMALAI